MKKNLLALVAWVATAFTLSAESAPLWLRYNTISPDGTQIAFAYQGDIYVVPVQGGTARQLTTSASYESQPVWSHDGKTLAFASDRNGGFDIYTIPVSGGRLNRVTYHSTSEAPLAFSADDTQLYFSAAIQDPASSILFPTSWMTELYAIPVDGGRPTQVAATPVRNMSLAADGKSYLYENCTGSENTWRKHHTSSVARNIWYYDAATNMHRQLTTNVGEDRNPIFVAPGQMVFLSERDGGTFNIYQASLSDPENVTALTKFKKHPIRFLSAAENGTLCFGYHGEIYTLDPGKKAQKVKIQIVKEEEDNRTSNFAVRGASEFAVSKDGKDMAIISRGEVFAFTDKHGTTRQITFTPAAEAGLTISPDGKTLIYASERTGIWNLYKATMPREEDLHFAYATSIQEEPLFKDNKVERTNPSFSPDGKEVAFIEDRTFLKVLNLESGKVRQITDGSQHYTRQEYGFTYQWSPDGNWFALEIITNQRDPYADIAIVSAKDGGTCYNVTNSGYIDQAPRWVMDGNALIYISNRHGMRSHASWGSQNDVYIAFMNQETMDKFLMSKEEYDRYQEVKKFREKKAKEAEEKDKKEDKKGDKKADTKAEKKEDKKPVQMDLAKLDQRIVRLTPMSSDLTDAVLSNDGEALYFLTKFEGGRDLWKMDVRERRVSTLKKGSGGSGLMMMPDGKSLLLLGSRLSKVELPSGKSTPIEYSAVMELDAAGEREYMFHHVFKQQKEKFYKKNYHGVDLAALEKDYQPFLPYIKNNYDFSEMLSEILGELNVSHTGSGYGGRGAQKSTPEFGLLFDWNYKGNGLKVDEVLDFGPFDNFQTKVKEGTIIETFNGEKILAGEDYFELINGKMGENNLIGCYNPSTGERWEEVTQLTSRSHQNELLYQRWIRTMEHLVDSLSGGRLGYVHIRSMGDGSYRDVYADILGKYNLREGIVIDTRNNGGGRLHEDIEILFSGTKYLEQVIQGRVACEMPSRRYNKPSVMVVCEANYSNAHGTPWVYQTMGLGKVVGMPVPGTMTSVNWETLQDPSMYFGIPVVGYRTKEGKYLENLQLEPDYKVRNEYEKAMKGQDQQIEKAVQVLLEEVKNDKTRW
ncbi:MAG: PD40 domain-containing protein [Bacteroidales bacterium]|nr:PD40 domain-containing protein [Bacteroidales bacterium]